MANKKDLKNIKGFKEISNVFKKHKRFIDSGAVAEFWCEQLFGIQLAKRNQKGFDGIKDNQRIEIKYRHSGLWSKDIPPSMAISIEKISFLYFVKLDEDLLPEIIYKIAKKDIEQKGKRVYFDKAYKNGKCIIVFERD